MSRRIAFHWADRDLEITLETRGGHAVLTREGRTFEAEVRREGRHYEVHGPRGISRLTAVAGARDVWVAFDGRTYRLERSHRAAGARGGEASSDEIRAPMTGRVVRVVVTPGAVVREGDLLLTIEAMKMEFRLTAPEEGVVAELHGVEGAQVELGQLLVRLTPSSGEGHPS